MSAKPRNKPGSALGTYSKGNAFSLSINFGISGGKMCSKKCIHHPKSSVKDAPKDCYADRAERRYDRKELLKKLQRHERLGPARVCGMALVELQEHIRKGRRIDWLRISTNGAVPEWDSKQCTALFKSQFRALIAFASANNIKVHFPVETWEKADGYRSLVGDMIAVRQSVHSEQAFVSTEGAVSTSTGAGLPLMERVEASRKLAQSRYQSSGRNTIVCPAVVSSFRVKLCRDSALKPKLQALADRSKCGNCTACANPTMDIVYPAH